MLLFFSTHEKNVNCGAVEKMSVQTLNGVITMLSVRWALGIKECIQMWVHVYSDIPYL